MPYQKIILVSGPVIVKNDKILLDISSDDNFWKFCGGKVKKDESLQNTAIRRAKEELGINVSITNDTPFLLYTTKEVDNNKNDVILAHFLADTNDKIIPGEDVKEWAWIPIEELKNENLAPNIIPTLKHFWFIK